MKLEVDDLALIAWKRLENIQNPSKCLPGVVQFVQVLDNGNVGEVEGCHPRRRFAGIERQIPTHREQPGREVSADPRGILPAQPQKGLLHDIPRQFQIADQPLRIANQRPFVAVEGFSHPFGVRRAAHVGLLLKITDVRGLY